MCGRFSDTMSWQEIHDLYRITSPRQKAWNLQPNWNAAPTQRLPIVRDDGEGGGRICVPARWGLLPPWAKSEKDVKLSTFNARAEGIVKSRLYARPFKRQRCIVPATSWFEWKKEGAAKQPYAIRVKGAGFGFAGLYDVWRSGDETIESFTIVTTDAAPSIAHLHDRMPRVLVGAEMAQWLEGDEAAAAELFSPSSAEFEFWPVDKAVGSVRNNRPDLLSRLP